MIIARWTNEERTKSCSLDSDGTLSYIERGHQAHVWSSPYRLEFDGTDEKFKELVKSYDPRTNT